MPTKKFTAVIYKEGEQYTAKCPEVGTESQGSTENEALANLKEATDVYLTVFDLKAKMENPVFKTFEAEYKIEK